MTNADRTEVKNFVKAVRVEMDRRNAEKFVEDEAGMSLISDTEITRLAGIETGAQKNVIEGITLDGVAQSVDTDTKTIALNLDDYAKKSDISAALKYKGSKDTFAALPATGNENGDLWNIKIAGGTDRHGVAIKAGDNVAYIVDEDNPSETGWDVQGGTTDLSGYLDADTYKDLLDTMLEENDETFTTADIADIFADDDSSDDGSNG